MINSYKLNINKVLIRVTLFITIILIIVGLTSCVSPRYSKRKIKKDTKFFYEKIAEIHPNIYAHYPKSEFSKDSLNLTNSLRQMNRLEYYRLLKPIMAKIKDGHTRLTLPIWIDVLNQRKKSLKWFPLNVVIHNDNAYVVNAGRNPNDIPIGSKIISINNIPINDIVSKMLAFNESYTKSCFVNNIESDLGRYLWEYFGFTDAFKVKYEQPNSVVKEDTIVGQLPYLTAMESYYWSQKYNSSKSLMPKPIISDENSSFSYKIFNDNTYAYINFFSCKRDNSNDSLLYTFFSILNEKKIKNLIIDARYNYGGATSVNEKLLQYIGNKPYTSVSEAYVKTSLLLKKYYKDDKEFTPYIINEVKKYYDGKFTISNSPLLFKGQVYVLAGTETFSSGANFVAVVKDCGLATVIGYETGGLASGYGDYLKFTLPNSRLKLQVATKYLVRPSGNKQPSGVIPDIIVNKTLNDKLYNIDTVLEKTIQLIKCK